jgi:DNA-directed RNA polymerase specialized sigma24 family protein
MVATHTVLRGADETALGELIDEHYGAMHRLGRLVAEDPDGAAETVRTAWRTALARPDEQPSATGLRGWLLRLVLDAIVLPEPPAEPEPVASPDDFEDPSGRWAGWWKDAQSKTPPAEPELLEAILATLPPALAALLVMRDVEGLPPGEVAMLLGYAPDQQLRLLHYGRTAVRNRLRAGVKS